MSMDAHILHRYDRAPHARFRPVHPQLSMNIHLRFCSISAFYPMIIAAKAGFVNLFGGKISPAEVSAGEMQCESSMMPLQTAGIKAAFFKAAIIFQQLLKGDRPEAVDVHAGIQNIFPRGDQRIKVGACVVMNMPVDHI